MRRFLKTLVFVSLMALIVMSAISCNNSQDSKEPNGQTTPVPTEQTDPIDPDQTEPHKHTYQATVTAPSCEKEGFTTYTCSCGDSYVADKVAALGHTAGAATCTAPKTCVTCNAKLAPARGHSWTDATCITPKTCSLCGETDGSVSAEHTTDDAGICTACKKSFVLSVEEAIAIGMSYEKGQYSSEYYYVQLTLDHQVNPNGFARATIADGLYVSVAGPYATGYAEGTIQLGDTVIYKAKLGAVNSVLTTGGKELRLYEVASYKIHNTHTPDDDFMCSICGKSVLISVDEAIEIGMSYEKGQYSSEYYYVQLTLDNQVNPNGFARATIADGLYVTVAGPYAADYVEGTIQLGDTVIYKAKLGAANSALTAGGKELRLYEVASYKVLTYDDVYVSATLDGKSDVVTYHSSFAGLTEVDKAPIGVTFDLGYRYVKKSGLSDITKSALVWNTYGKYNSIAFDIYVDKITDESKNAYTEVELQLSQGVRFVSVVDANGKKMDIVYKESPYVVLQKGQSYHIVIDVSDVSSPAFCFGFNNKTCEIYFYNFSIVCNSTTAPTEEVTLTFVGGVADDDGIDNGDGLLITTLTGNVGENILLPTDPTKKGYKFEGWYLDYAGTVPFTETTYGKDLIIYAKWTAEARESLPVMSFNVKVNELSDYLNSSRADLVADTILENNPYVFGVQEADDLWMSRLNDKLGHLYTSVGKGRDGNSGEHCAIFYQTNMFTLIESGTKWLSATPDTEGSKYSCTEGGTTYTANYPRIMTYVVLERKSDGVRFIYVNTHLDNNGDNGSAAEKIRQGQVEILVAEIQKLYQKHGNLPTVISGDFNTQPETASYKAMLQSGFIDSSKVAKQGEIKPTYNNNDDNFAGIIFDYVFVSPDLVNGVKNYTVSPSKKDGQWFSDHNAITTTIVFPIS